LHLFIHAFILAVLGMESTALHMLGKCSATELTLSLHSFCLTCQLQALPVFCKYVCAFIHIFADICIYTPNICIYTRIHIHIYVNG
jgi:hypothetical protein